MASNKDSGWKAIALFANREKVSGAKKTKSVDIALNAKANDLAEWSYKVTNEGRLSLYEGDRVLVPHKDYNADEDVSYFGNYSSTYSEKMCEDSLCTPHRMFQLQAPLQCLRKDNVCA